MGGYTLVGWLSGFWAQIGSVTNSRYETFVRRLGEAAASEGGDCGPFPDFALYTLAFALQLGKITGKPQSGHPKGARLISVERDSFSRLGRRLAMTSTDLLAPVTFGFRVRRRGRPSVSAVICRVAELGDSPRQVTLSQSSQLDCNTCSLRTWVRAADLQNVSWTRFRRSRKP
jgi:hypothetical protein